MIGVIKTRSAITNPKSRKWNAFTCLKVKFKVSSIKNSKTERLSLVRDIFLFSCFTGLAYIDVKNLTKSHISIGINGEKWIFTHRQKTETASKIPIFTITQMIIDKYKDNSECDIKNTLLPILSNQKMNSYLKEIAGVCGINKELTFHIARHTFATTVMLTNGVPIESVSKMLGHKNLKTTQHYAKVLDKKVSVDMRILRDKFAITLPLKTKKWINANVKKNFFSQIEINKHHFIKILNHTFAFALCKYGAGFVK